MYVSNMSLCICFLAVLYAHWHSVCFGWVAACAVLRLQLGPVVLTGLLPVETERRVHLRIAGIASGERGMSGVVAAGKEGPWEEEVASVLVFLDVVFGLTR